VQWGESGALVVVANLSESETKAVSLELPREAGTKLTPAFKGRPAGLKLVNGKMTGELAQAEVHVYRIAR
jgi:hypothetical protein